MNNQTGSGEMAARGFEINMLIAPAFRHFQEAFAIARPVKPKSHRDGHARTRYPKATWPAPATSTVQKVRRFRSCIIVCAGPGLRIWPLKLRGGQSKMTMKENSNAARRRKKKNDDLKSNALDKQHHLLRFLISPEQTLNHLPNDAVYLHLPYSLNRSPLNQYKWTMTAIYFPFPPQALARQTQSQSTLS